MQLTDSSGQPVSDYSIEYRVHIQDYGWSQEWLKDGAIAGSIGESKQLEAIQIRIVPKFILIPTFPENSFLVGDPAVIGLHFENGLNQAAIIRTELQLFSAPDEVIFSKDQLTTIPANTIKESQFAFTIPENIPSGQYQIPLSTYRMGVNSEPEILLNTIYADKPLVIYRAQNDFKILNPDLFY